jgi:hypothetical protein
LIAIILGVAVVVFITFIACFASALITLTDRILAVYKIIVALIEQVVADLAGRDPGAVIVLAIREPVVVIVNSIVAVEPLLAAHIEVAVVVAAISEPIPVIVFVVLAVADLLTLKERAAAEGIIAVNGAILVVVFPVGAVFCVEASAKEGGANQQNKQRPLHRANHFASPGVRVIVAVDAPSRR